MVQLPKRIRLPHEQYADRERVFHVVFRAAVGEQPFANPALGEAIWKLVLNERARGSVRPIAACLMPDHLHLLVSPRDRDVIKWVNGFKSWSTRVAQAHRNPRILWQPGFYDRVVRGEDVFAAALRYVLENPVAEGLVDDWEQWPWSGLWLEDDPG